MPNKTALQNAQEVARRIGIIVPTSLFATPNRNAAQLGALLNAVLEDLTERWNWPESTRQATVTIVSGTNQGPVDTVIGDGFKSLVLDSGWNRTRNIHLRGPIDAPGWAALRAFPARGLLDTFRIMEGRLHIDSPQTQVGDTVTFEYYSKNVVNKTGGGTSQIYEADGDVAVIPDTVIRAGLMWQWKQNKGLAYAEEKRTYELMAGTAAARGGNAGRRYLDDGPEGYSTEGGRVTMI